MKLFKKQICIFNKFSNFVTKNCSKNVQFLINSNVLYLPSRFLSFHIPLIFILQQLKITMFQPIKLLIFCISTIRVIIQGLVKYQLLQIFNRKTDHFRQHFGICYWEMTQIDQGEYHLFHYFLVYTEELQAKLSQTPNG